MPDISPAEALRQIAALPVMHNRHGLGAYDRWINAEDLHRILDQVNKDALGEGVEYVEMDDYGPMWPRFSEPNKDTTHSHRYQTWYSEWEPIHAADS